MGGRVAAPAFAQQSELGNAKVATRTHTSIAKGATPIAGYSERVVLPQCKDELNKLAAAVRTKMSTCYEEHGGQLSIGTLPMAMES